MKKQNTSPAVMAQRKEPPDSLDDFPTPPWATRAFFEHVVIRDSHYWKRCGVWEPAAGRGHMARTIREYCGNVKAWDIYPYNDDLDAVMDFLEVPVCQETYDCADWIITNPPFNRAEEFALHAMQFVTDGVALFVRTQFIESVGRFHNLFNVRRPYCVAQFSERVTLTKGRLEPGGGSATAYCWIVWRRCWHGETRLKWIPPCRKQLEREGDYELE